jgi:hypothetical protein
MCTVARYVLNVLVLVSPSALREFRALSNMHLHKGTKVLLVQSTSEAVSLHVGLV